MAIQTSIPGRIIVESPGRGIVDFTSIPDEVTEDTQATWNEMSDILSRSAPFYSYASSNGRKISFTLQIHSDVSADNVERDVRVLQSTQFPDYKSQVVKPPPLVRCIIGNDWIKIQGILVLGGITWSSPYDINSGKPMNASAAIEVWEVFNTLPETSRWPN